MNQYKVLFNSISKIAWGFVFIFFHIKIGAFDILPDFVGYILIAMGISAAYESFRHINALKPLSVALSVFYAAVWVIKSFSISIPYVGYISIISGIAAIVFNFLLMTDLSIISTEYQSESNDISKKFIIARNTDIIYRILMLITSFSSLALLAINESIAKITAIASTVLVIPMLAVIIIILSALSALKKAIKAKEAASSCDTSGYPPYSYNNPSDFHIAPPSNENRTDYHKNSEE